MGLCGRFTRQFFARSDRVKAVSVHPELPLVASALYDGCLKLCNYNSLEVCVDIEASSLPLRTVCFISLKEWVACAGDDCCIYCFSINTNKKIFAIQDAHKDYIRSLSVHPNKPLAISSSDDMTIKLWDLDDGWARLCTFEGHSHYVMQAVWSPRDPSIFASCSLDRSIKVWGIGSVGPGSKAVGSGSGSTGIVSSPHFTLLGHERGVNAIAYSNSGERPYLVSGADDATVRVWDYQTKQCIQVLNGHTANVCAVLFPSSGLHTFPVLVSGGEDGCLCVWRLNTFKQEDCLSLGLQRVWGFAAKAANAAAERDTGCLVLAIATDSGTLVMKMGKDGPVVSAHTGKVVAARGFELLQFNLKQIDAAAAAAAADGEKVQCPSKEIGTSDIFPQSISHHPNGRFIAVVGDGEYVIYTAQALRSKAFGAGDDLVWSQENHYAVLEKENRIKIYCNFEEAYNFTPPFAVEEIFGGFLLGVRSEDAICFYDWNSYRLIRRIEALPTAVYWSADGLLVALITKDAVTGPGPQTTGSSNLYILRHDKFAVMAANTAQALEEEDGIPIAFELVHQTEESVGSGLWVLNSFFYITKSGRVCCLTGERLQSVHTVEGGELFQLVSYIPEQNLLYLFNSKHQFLPVSYSFALIHYKGAVARGDLQAAEDLFPQLPVETHDEAAKTLQVHGYIAEALAVARDEELRFELALAIGNLQMCADLIRNSSSSSSATKRQNWAAVGDAALQKGSFTLAAAAFWECGDYPSLLLLYSSSGDVERLRELAAAAAAAQQQQVAFMCYLLLQQTEDCVDLLLAAGRGPEAALFARTYCPSAVDKAVKVWRESRTAAAAAAAAAAATTTRTAANNTGKTNALSRPPEELPAYPSERSDAFPNWEAAKQAEIETKELYRRKVAAASYNKVQQLLEADVLQTIQEAGPDALRDMLLSDVLPISAAEPRNASTHLNGDVLNSFAARGTAANTAAADSSSPMTAANATPSPSSDEWQQQQQMQQQQHLQQQQVQQLQKESAVFSPQQHGDFTNQQQQQQQFAGAFAAAANPFTNAALGKEFNNISLGSPGLYGDAQQRSLQQQQQQQQQMQQELQQEQQYLAKQLQQQQDFLEEEAKRLDGDEWQETAAAAEGAGGAAAVAGAAAAAAAEEEAEQYSADVL